MSRAERARQVASELGVRAFESLDALLDACDALTIVVPTPAHYAVASAALERGTPPADREADRGDARRKPTSCWRSRRAPARSCRPGHVERFNRAVRAALPYVDAPRFIDSDRLAPFNPRGSDVAVVLDLMIHDIDLVLTLVGSQVADVAAVGVPVLTPFVDIANARVAFASGAVANITASRVSRERMRKIRIFQQSGYLSLDLAAGDGEFYRLRRRRRSRPRSPKAPLALEAFVERIPLDAPEGEPLRLEFESFVAAVRGEQPVVVTGEDGREALAVALRIVREIERTLPSLAGVTESRGVGTVARA